MLGIDIGGTKTRVVSDSGELIAHYPSPKNPDEAVKKLLDILPKEAVGVGVAGMVTREGVVHHAPNLGWYNFPLREKLKSALGAPVIVLNDVRAATYGEWQIGAGKGCNNLACLFYGTGLGGGFVVEGRLLHGSDGFAGEIGHTTVDLDGKPCSCGNKGCLEAYGIEGLEITIHNVRALFNPEIIILGGGLIEGLKTLPNGTKRSFLGADAVAIGAALFSLQNI